MLGNSWISNIRRLSKIYAGIVALAAVTLGGFVYTANEVTSYAESKAAVRADIRGLSDVFEYGGGAALISTLKQRTPENAPAAFYFLQDRGGTLLAGNFKELPEAPSDIVPPYIIYEIPYATMAKEAPARRDMFADHADVLGEVLNLKNGWVLFAGRDVEVFQEGRQVIHALSYVVFLLLVLFALVGFVVASLILRRIRTIADTADQIMITGDLSTRIDVEKMSGEFRELGCRLNEMLGKIQALVHGIRQVSDDIAHDLRTPLTRLQHHLEELSQETPGPGIERAIAEAERIVLTFNALLRIARIENNTTQHAFEVVDLGDLVRDVVEYYEPFADQSKCAIRAEIISGANTVMADRHMVFQALSNLIENAIRYSPEKGHILLKVRDTLAGTVEVIVRDQGPGIPNNEKERVFDRFYRTESSRTSAGNGLGLALVKAVVDLHAAKVSLQDANPQGLEVRIAFKNLTNP